MVDYSIMFEVQEGGVSVPIKWGKDQLQPDRSIIILDESSMGLFLWHGKRQGLVARRTALRQAESLKGHGYTIGKSIIGRDIKTIKEIDNRKVGREPNTTELNQELQEILNKDYKELDNYIITFQTKGIDTISDISTRKTQTTSEIAPKPVTQPKSEPTIKKSISTQPKAEPEISKPNKVAIPKSPLKVKEEPKVEVKHEKVIDRNLEMEAKIGFVLISIMEHFDDIWVSKKDDGSFAVEYMEGPICEFQIKSGKINFSSNSFSGISTNIKTEIKKKFVELNSLIS